MANEINLIDVSSPKALKQTLNTVVTTNAAAIAAAQQAYNKAVSVEEHAVTKEYLDSDEFYISAARIHNLFRTNGGNSNE